MIRDPFETAAKRAKATVARAVREGRLPPVGTLRCVDCGGEAVSYEHRDYTRRLDVEPCCQSCNLLRGRARWARPFEPSPERYTAAEWRRIVKARARIR